MKDTQFHLPCIYFEFKWIDYMLIIIIQDNTTQHINIYAYILLSSPFHLHSSTYVATNFLWGWKMNNERVTNHIRICITTGACQSLKLAMKNSTIVNRRVIDKLLELNIWIRISNIFDRYTNICMQIHYNQS